MQKESWKMKKLNLFERDAIWYDYADSLSELGIEGTKTLKGSELAHLFLPVSFFLII